VRAIFDSTPAQRTERQPHSCFVAENFPDGFRQECGRIGFLQEPSQALAGETLDGFHFIES
jgi:hypothetical protein